MTFSEPVDAPAGAFSLDCAVAGPQGITVSGGPTTFSLDPTSDLSDNDRCTVRVESTLVTDQDLIDPPDTMAEDYTFSFQTTLTCAGEYTPAARHPGTRCRSPIAGEWVVTEGIVVGDYEGTTSTTLRGFYLQEPDAGVDADPATSEAVFVFNSRADEVTLGQRVRVTGFVSEFQGQTQVVDEPGCRPAAAPAPSSRPP